MTALRFRPGFRLWLLALAAGLALALMPVAALAANTLVARVDSTDVTLGDSIIYEVTLSLTDGRAEGYQAPDFHGFRVVGEQPSHSTQIQMGGGTNFTRTVYNWRYELSPTQSGRLTIGVARVKADGHELKSLPVSINVASGALSPGSSSGQAGVPPPPRVRPRPRSALRSPFDDLFGRGAEPDEEPQRASAEGSFVRAVADKTKVFVGEQVVVEWFLYLTERQDKYQALTEPRTDGFWTEDLTVPNNQGSLALTQQEYQGRVYLVAPLLRKALFPLQPGTLTVTPLESEISQIDFFGRNLRTQRLKAAPLTIEVQPLPTAGRPAGFDPASVGHFTLESKLDRTQVGVGEAVTLTVTVRGQGNIRKLAPPRLAPLDGWKTYEPKIDVKIQNDSGISGQKTVEYLMLPDRPGTTIIPAFELAYFDPQARHYAVEKSAPLRVEVTGEARPGAHPGAGPSPSVAGAGVENVLPSEIRPPRAHATLSRDLGTTFYQSRLFLWTVFLPPLAFGITVAMGRVRERMGQETEGARRRKTRRLVRHHLRAAESRLDEDNPAAFYVEIDRVLREVLTARLGPIAGLPREELQTLIANSGLGRGVAERTVAQLEQCDRARFAPGSVDQSEMRAALERAAELILHIEKAPARPEALS